VGRGKTTDRYVKGPEGYVMWVKGHNGVVARKRGWMRALTKA